jgi:adenine-specific DNA-methyltransferase
MSLEHLTNALMDLIPEDGSGVGNIALRQQLGKKLGREIEEGEYAEARDALVSQGRLVKGQGRGGSVRRPGTAPVLEDLAEAPTVAVEAAARAPRKTKVQAAASTPIAEEAAIRSYRHTDRRANNPEVGLVKPENDPDQPKTVWSFDPHLDPELRFDIGRSQVEGVIDEALTSEDPKVLREALLELKRLQAPYLIWTGKAERTSFEVDTVSLHVHERVDPASILAAVRKGQTATTAQRAAEFVQPNLFEAPWEQVPLREAIDFYRHDRGWANRLVTGDSLLVMNSLLQKENMAGQVQMVYIDPPYGIKYGSNFQPFVKKEKGDARKVQDRKDEDLTQEPEMIKAFRDTWELGIHSYLTYLRDRLLLAKELMHSSGSVFVQISDENLHHVKEILDDIFGSENYLNIIPFSKTSGITTDFLASNVDFLIWYGKDKSKTKYFNLFIEKSRESGTANTYSWIDSPNSPRRGMSAAEKRGEAELPINAKLYKPDNITSQGNPVIPCCHKGKTYEQAWKMDKEGVGFQRLAVAGRLHVASNTLQYVRYLSDFACIPITQLWDDMQTGNFTEDKTYVVQTAEKVIQRCLLMTTDPGDLVIDPTCGSGTTAVVAEKWGRRWITCDTSRVAVTLAKARLMTAGFDYYELKYPHEGLKGGFVYETVPHVTLKSIANNPDIDTIYEAHRPKIMAALAALNTDLRMAPPSPFTVEEGGRKGQRVDFKAPESKTVKLPSGEDAPAGALLEWEVPFDLPDGWPEAPFAAFHAARQAMQKAMDASIAAHADQEQLFDKPQVDRSKKRITGPFTVEAVPSPTVVSLDEQVVPQEADQAIARSGHSARAHDWMDELLKTGIRGKGGQMMKFAGLEPLPGLKHLHALGTLAESGDRVLVAFGPEHAAMEQKQVALALHEAEKVRPSARHIVFCAFAFDPEAAKDIDETNWAGVNLLKVQMNTDLLTEDLKKARSNNQSFWLMGQPDVELKRQPDGLFQVEVHGFDYFDTVKGELVSGGKGKIAAWLLDTDYDNRSLYPRQVFFPMAGDKEGWNKLRRDIRAELDESLLDAFHGTVSLPFEAGDHRQVAVKIVDDRGIESLKIIALD